MPSVRHEPGIKPPRAVLELDSVGVHLRAVRTAKWKFVDVIGSDKPFYFDLAADPKEQHPLFDLASELGKRSSQAYLAEVEGLDAWFKLHPPTAVTSQIPGDVEHGLKHYGYVGGDDEGGAPQGTPPK